MDSALSASLRDLSQASAPFSSRLTSPVDAFARCVSAATKAIAASPSDERSVAKALAPVGAHMEDVEESSFSAGPGDVLEAHLPALAAAVKAFTCLTAAPPAGAVADARALCARRLAPVRAKGGEHERWADALDAVLSAMEGYCAAQLPEPLGRRGGAAAAGAAAGGAAGKAPVGKHAQVKMPKAARMSSGGGGVARQASARRELEPATTASSVSSVTRGVAAVSVGGGNGTSTGGGSSDRPGVVAFDAIISGPLAEYRVAADALGADMRPVTDAFVAAFKEEREYIANAAVTKKPAEPDYSAVGAAMGKCGSVAEEYPPSGELSKHVQAISESLPALGWVAVDTGATGFVKDQAGAGQMYIDRVKMAAKKTSDPTVHRTWATALEGLFKELVAYVKEYHTNSMQWNVPVTRSMSGGGGGVAAGGAFMGGDDEEESGADAVSAFKDILAGSLAAYVAAATALGPDMKKQTDAFVAAWKAEDDFIAKSATTPKPAEPDFSVVGGLMGAVGEAGQDYPPRGDFANHITAVSESVAALGWIAVDTGATNFVGDQAGAGQMYVDRVKMAAKKSSNPAAHREWAAAYEALYKDLKAYVKEYHTSALVWNSAAMKKPRSSSRGRRATVMADDGPAAGADPVSAFKALIDGPLAAYVSASAGLGADLKPQTDAFVEAWKAEEAFIAKAATMPKPAEPDFSVVGGLMGKVGEIGGNYPPRGELGNHVTAVSESVAALGWIAVDSGATSFVGDQAGAGQMYVDRVKMGAKKSSNPEAHRAWAAALETLFKELKAYTKEYHTSSLQWNSASRRAGAGPRVAARAPISAGEDSDNSLSAFAALVAGPVKTCMETGKSIGGGVSVQSVAMFDAFKAEYELLVQAAGRPKPDADTFADMIDPTGAAMGIVADAADSINDHLMTAMAESIPALGWIAVDSAPTKFISEYMDAGAFYTSKALMDARSLPTDEKKKIQAFSRSFKEVYTGLGAFVKAHHVSGLIWNNKVKPPASTGF